MARFLARRLVLMLLTVVAISVISFFIIILPPGDFVDRLVQEANQYGENLEPHEIEDLRRNYGLDRSAVEQYFVWVRNIVLRGDFGYSFGWDLPVSELIGQRLGPDSSSFGRYAALCLDRGGPGRDLCGSAKVLAG